MHGVKGAVRADPVFAAQPVVRNRTGFGLGNIHAGRGGIAGIRCYREGCGGHGCGSAGFGFRGGTDDSRAFLGGFRSFVLKPCTLISRMAYIWNMHFIIIFS